MTSTAPEHLNEFEVELNFNYEFADESTTCFDPLPLYENDIAPSQELKREFTIVEEIVKIEDTVIQDVSIKGEDIKNEGQEAVVEQLKVSTNRKHYGNKRIRSKLECNICEIGFNSIVQKRRHLKLHNAKSTPICHLCGIFIKTFGQLEDHYLIHRVKRIKKSPKKVKRKVGQFKNDSLKEERGRNELSTKIKNRKTISVTTIKRKKEINVDRPPQQDFNYNVVNRTVKRKNKVVDKNKIQKEDSKYSKITKQPNTVKNKTETNRSNVLKKTEIERIYKTSLIPIYKHDNGLVYYKCSECSQETNNRFFMTEHIKSHTLETDLKCPVCFKLLRYRASLTSHLKIHSVRKFECKICSNSFVTKAQLKRHLKIHLGQRDFKCSICSKTFMFKYNLQLHLKHHSGVKDFYCAICNRAFLLKVHLKAHLKTHNKIEEEYKCPHCPRVFKLKSSHTGHVRSHPDENGFKCSICSKSFPLRRNLTVHMKVHRIREKKYCFHCLKGFKDKKTLIVHFATHSDERNYNCDICSRSFKLKCHLVAHKRKVHHSTN
ncbi:uncharacterized protein [Diabrotica undecimpunctata]|uniref:uncharacterized protein n=1 Tax=Diabrotica undecimpunctata TaxID=50387 RepID=UPI003B64016D